MLKFLSIGSGSSGNCYLLYTETDCLMIDCGVGVRTMKKHFNSYGLQLSMVRHIILTHDHTDHVKSVGSLSRKLMVPVFSTSLVHQGIKRQALEPSMIKLIEKGKPKKIGEFEVTPFNVPHDSKDCVGYYVKHEQVAFTIVTDCGHVTEEIKNYIARANYLVIEANHETEKLLAGPYPQYLKERISSENGHLSNRDCAFAIVENATTNLRNVWICHLSDENNHPELARKTIETILNDSGLRPGKDFGLEVLKRKSPSEVYNLV